MFKPAEYVFDFKSKDGDSNTNTSYIEDCDLTTATASEADSNGCTSPTPPLFCKLKKARVMIKKLPQHVLEKYNLDTKKAAHRSLPPVRVSNRTGGKQVPGQYLSLHVNKPLDVLANKKKKYKYAKGHAREKRKVSQQIRNEISHNYSNLKKPQASSASWCRKLYKNTIKQSGLKNSSAAALKNSSLTSGRKLNDKIRTVNQLVAPTTSLNSSAVINSMIQNSYSTDRRSLFEKIASTRLISSEGMFGNQISKLPNYSEVGKSKYGIAPKHSIKSQRNISARPFSNNNNAVVTPPSSAGSNYTKKSVLASTPQRNTNLHTFLPSGTISNNAHIKNIHPTNAFPTSIKPAAHYRQSTCEPSVRCDQPNNSPKSLISAQNCTVPHTAVTKNDSIIVSAPKVLIINQPSQGSDPLEMSMTRNKAASESSQVDLTNIPDCDTRQYSESETELDSSDTEKQTEPEVIKRIIYHSKAVQTKFTCHNSICGLVEAGDFNLNCFYCYDIFPLHKWLEFKEHVKRVHNVEEKENQSEFHENVEHSNSRACGPEAFANTISTKPVTLNQRSAVKKTTNTIEQASKMFPYDPRYIGQRFYIATKQSDTIPQPSSQQLSLPVKSKTPAKSSKKKQLLTGNLQKHRIDEEVINLDSDDGGDDLTKKAPGTSNTDNSKNSVSKNDEAASNFTLPTLPHITIKKLEKDPKEPIKSLQYPVVQSYSKQPFLNSPSNLNVHKVIKSLPTPTTKQQLSADGGTRPRYFVVKKIIKLPTTEMLPNVNLPKGVMLAKTSEPEKGNNTKINDNSDVMSTSAEHEDSVPKRTNGRGILFGVTNSMVVIEFLLKLKTFPELWRPQLKSDIAVNCDNSIRKMREHLNNRFDLNITDLEIRQSIQRIRDWYGRTLKSMNEYNNNLNNTEPYNHKFPLYFRILNQFLVSDTSTPKSPKSTQCKTVAQKVEAIKSKSPIDVQQRITAPQPVIMASAPAIATLPTKPNVVTATPEITVAEGLIEFDADTLYGHESSEEEVVEKIPGIKVTPKLIVEAVKPKKKKVEGEHFECDICHKTYKRKYELKRHQIMHLPPQFECGVCSEKHFFQRWAEKCAHLKKKKRRKNIGGKTSEQDNGMEKSKRIWPKKIFRFKMICEICGASYRSIGSLNTHKRDKHLNQREKCVVCNFTALSNWRIVQHQKKRHIVEPGLVEEVAKKSRARTDTKTPFSNEARQEFFWRREMRQKLKPGEILHACCKCRIVFNSRKEKVFHNKTEHPIKETTVLCLLCLPSKLLLSNSNCARRHYTDIHKVPWHEIDSLVKRTKPIYSLLSKEEIELLQTSANYKELLEELLKDKQLDPIQKVEILEEDETSKAVDNLSSTSSINEMDEEEEELNKMDIEYTQENVYIDCIIDHDYSNGEELFNEHEYTSNNEHNYSEDQEINKNERETAAIDDNLNKNKNIYSKEQLYEDRSIHLDYGIESSDSNIYNSSQNDQEYLQNFDEFIEGEMVEESLVVEECIDEVIDEEDEEYF